MINYIITKIEALYSDKNVILRNTLTHKFVKSNTDYRQIVLLCQKKHLIRMRNYS